MTEQHPITPPPELVQQWVAATESNDCIGAFPTNFEQRICTAAAQWGADQELEACCEWLSNESKTALGQTAALRAARRPKPPSLKELAMALLRPGQTCLFNSEMQDTIRRALEALPDD
jgi:hypothetical protein